LRDRNGDLALAMWPNPALVVWLATVVVRLTGVVASERADLLNSIGQGALVVWSLDELVRGASPARRVLGAVVLAVQLVAVVKSLS
jgi:hypothetical protein